MCNINSKSRCSYKKKKCAKQPSSHAKRPTVAASACLYFREVTEKSIFPGGPVIRNFPRRHSIMHQFPSVSESGACVRSPPFPYVFRRDRVGPTIGRDWSHRRLMHSPYPRSFLIAESAYTPSITPAGLTFSDPPLRLLPLSLHLLVSICLRFEL